jgi:glycerophosphoryl diester phosphodiesterase
MNDIIVGNLPRPVVIAHRGASHYYHENTREAFLAAVNMKAEMMEFDVRRTADGVFVIHHDPDFDGRKIRGMTESEIRGRSGDAGYTIPTMVEILDLCAGKIPLDIELKESGYEEQVLNEILEVIEPDQFIITSVHDSAIRKVKDLRPDVRTGFILSSHPRWQLLTKLYPGRKAKQAGADVLVVSNKLLKVGFLSTTQDLGYPIWVYTVNERHEFWKLVREERVTAIFTDRPDLGLLLRDLHAAGQKSAPGIQDMD